jgi:hypothetical protein
MCCNGSRCHLLQPVLELAVGLSHVEKHTRRRLCLVGIDGLMLGVSRISLSRLDFGARFVLGGSTIMVSAGAVPVRLLPTATVTAVPSAAGTAAGASSSSGDGAAATGAAAKGAKAPSADGAMPTGTALALSTVSLTCLFPMFPSNGVAIASPLPISNLSASRLT